LQYLFCSSVYNMDDYAHQAARSKVRLSLADHNLNSNLILGLEEVIGRPLNLINNVPIPNFSAYPKIFFRRQIWSHTAGAEDINCGFINLPVLKHISRAVTTFSALRQIVRKAREEPVCVITYDLHLGISLAIRWAKRRFPSIHTCAVLPDIPNAVVLASGQGKNTIKNRFRAAVKMLFISQFDAYVLLTEQMRKLPVFARKPAIVMEGIYNNHQPPLPESTTDKKIILYTGQLNPAYGIETLLEAFWDLHRLDQNYELWFCGGGSMEKRIRALAEEVPGLQYFGYVDTKTVQKCQAQATVLVNPRQNNDSFARYAFPSKTMEYLASGRPVVGYKLDGIPEEYDPYIQYVQGNSAADLRDKLIEICSLPMQQRQFLGSAARTFILEKKNPRVQCKKIVDMLNKIPRTVKR